MNVKYTPQYLNKLEDLMSETDYILRYEKGNFQSGYCILKDAKVAIINKYYSLDGKINSLIEIIRSIEPDTSKMSDKNKQLLHDITQTLLQL
jgi:hypothetical protein